MKNTTEISSDKAADIMTGGSEKEKTRLEAFVDEKSLIKGPSEDDVKMMLAFKGLDQSISLKNPGLASFLKDAEAKGVEITSTEPAAQGAFGAYRELTSQATTSSFELKYSDVTLAVVDNRENNDIKKIGENLEKGLEAFKKLGDNPELVRLALPPVGSSTIDERLDFISRITKHSGGNYSADRWKNVKKDYLYLAEATKAGGDFISLGGLYSEMLDAINSNYWRDDYRTGLDYINNRFRDHPGELKCFIGLIRKGLNVDTALQVHKGLSQPPQDGDYEKAAAHFDDKDFWDPERVEFVMRDISGTTLGERVGIIRDIYDNSAGDYSEDNWKNTVKDFEYIKSKAPDGEALKKLSGHYNEMLNAIKSSYRRDDYRTGLDYINSRFNNHPGELKCFIDLIKKGLNVDTALQIHMSLPQPVKDGDYEKAAAHFNDKDFWNPDRVALVMEDVPGTALNERIGIIRDIYAHSGGSYNADRWKNAAGDYGKIREKGRPFAELAGNFAEMLRANGSNYWQKSYRSGLDFIAGELTDEPQKLASFIKLVSCKKGIDTAIEAYRKIQAPVKGADYGMRERVAEKLIGTDFPATYDMICRNILQGESLEDTASLTGAILALNPDIELPACEELLKKFQRDKKDLHSSTLADLLPLFYHDDWSELAAIVELIKKTSGNDRVEERKDALLRVFRDLYGDDRYKIEELSASFETAISFRGEKEKIAAATDRALTIHEGIKKSKIPRGKSAASLTIEVLEFLQKELKAGNLGKRRLDDVVAAFLESLFLADNVEDAKADFIHKIAPALESQIIHDEDEVIIGGVKLDKKKRGKR